ncbi:G-D-S-L family lipolytic protein [Flavobacterium sp.]|uniref:G-D-S-L family lipolytic protein n=1 Tax=Flavobacterium sp. TaxID=239 RepID=UPI003D6AFEF8
MIKNIKWLLLVSLSFVACNDDDAVSEEPVSAGSANFSKYVALGDSFAAGFSDGALFKKGQQNGYPSLLAQQFAQVGGGSFSAPLCGDDNKGGLLFMGVPIQGTRLYFNGVGPVPVPGLPVTEVTNHVTGPISNLGVPGAKSFHLLAAGYGNPAGVPGGLANPYFARFASSPSTSIIADALTQQPTFFSLWIGGNDVLSYATSGGIGVDQTGNPNPATYGPNDITDPTAFNSVYNGLVTQLVAGGKKGVVANLPYINTLPYFTTVPTNPVPLDVATATQLNTQLLGPIDAILTAYGEGARIVTLSAGSTNPLLIKDESLTNYSAQITGALMANGVPAAQAGLMGGLYGQARHARNTGDRDFVVLPTRSIIGTSQAGVPAPFDKVGVTYPLQDKDVLIPSETNAIKTATDAYNVTIKNAAEANDLAFFDAKSVMEQLVNGGIRFGNYHMTAAYVTGGAFSLDGIHPGARGYAMIANKFLEAINAKYGSTFRPIDLGNYQIQYPASL